VKVNSRPSSVRAGLVAVAVVCLALGAATPAAAAPAGEGRPNVIVVMTDDQTVDDMVVMNKTRRLLGDRGASFESFVTSYSLCCPSRATFLTGRYAHNHGVLGNPAIGDGTGGWPALYDRWNTLPVWLRQAGYRTGYVGKFLLGHADRFRKGVRQVPPGWSDWWGLPGFSKETMYGYKLSHDGKVRRYGNRPRDYQTDVFAGLARSFIRQRARRGQPFFLTVAPLAPHVEGVREDSARRIPPRPAPRHAASPVPPFERKPGYSTEALNEADVSDKPAWLAAKQPYSTQQLDHQTKVLYPARLRSLLAVDDLVAGIEKTLRRQGIADNTYVLFTSDNGYMLGEHRLSGKNWAYRESSDVPLLVRGPGIAPGSRPSGLASNVDLAPTIAAMTGITIPVSADGVSLMPLLTDGTEVRQDLLLESFEGHGRAPGASSKALGLGSHLGVRTTRYVYVEYFDGSRELYDLEVDPRQLINVVDDPAYAVVRSEMSERLRQLKRCFGATCRTP